MSRENLEAKILSCRSPNFSKVEQECKNAPKVNNVDQISFPLSTSGIKIVDSKGKRVRLVGVNWSGGHLIRQCPSGLEKKSMNEIVDKIKNLFQMNCVRLCYSIQMLYDKNPVQKKYISANPDLQNLTPLEVLDRTINALTKVGIMVILNCHTSKSQWCCDSSDGDGLWYNQEFNEKIFFQSSQKLATLYKNNPRVIGIDLRNQIRPKGNLYPTWGSGDKLTDWKMAAETCAEKVLNVSSHWLIFIGALDYQTDLTPVIEHPIKLSKPNKLVYTGHLYDYSWQGRMNSMNYNKYMQDLPYEKFQQIFYKSQTFVRTLGVPYLLGEFGQGNPNKYWQMISKYIQEKDLDFTYWCLDGYKCMNQNEIEKQETYGLFCQNFHKFRHPFKEQFCKMCACVQK